MLYYKKPWTAWSPWTRQRCPAQEPGKAWAEPSPDHAPAQQLEQPRDAAGIPGFGEGMN